jgi:Domain of unknown function (DUF4386)
MSDSPDLDHRLLFASFAIAAGVLSVLLIVSAAGPPPPPPAELLSWFEAHRGRYVLLGVAVLSWATAAVPFVAGLGALLAPRGKALARAAMLLAAGGVLLLGFATFAFVGAFSAVSAAARVAPSPAEAAYQAAIWSHLSFYLTDPGLMTLGLGQFLFAVLAWRSGSLPKLVAAIGFVGGLAGLLTLAVYETGALALTQLAAFGVWGLATGVILLRRPGPPRARRPRRKLSSELHHHARAPDDLTAAQVRVPDAALAGPSPHGPGARPWRARPAR